MKQTDILQRQIMRELDTVETLRTFRQFLPCKKWLWKLTDKHWKVIRKLQKQIEIIKSDKPIKEKLLDMVLLEYSSRLKGGRK